VFLDGVYRELGDEVLFEPLGHLATSEVAEVLERAVRRMMKYLKRRGLLEGEDQDEADGPGRDENGEMRGLAASAVSGTPPAGPEFRRKLPALVRGETTFEGKLCVRYGDFTLHARTRAGAMDEKGREALLRYILRPPIAQERVTEGPEGLVRITLKKPFSDGTVAIDLDPLSLLTRLCASVPPPKVHTVRYAGVLASASRLRSRVVPKPKGREQEPVADDGSNEEKPKGSRYWRWSELLKRTFDIELLCPTCQEPMKVAALVRDDESIVRFLKSRGEATEAPRREPARGPPFFRSKAVRRLASEDAS